MPHDFDSDFSADFGDWGGDSVDGAGDYGGGGDFEGGSGWSESAGNGSEHEIVETYSVSERIGNIEFIEFSELDVMSGEQATFKVEVGAKDQLGDGGTGLFHDGTKSQSDSDSIVGGHRPGERQEMGTGDHDVSERDVHSRPERGFPFDHLRDFFDRPEEGPGLLREEVPNPHTPHGVGSESPHIYSRSNPIGEEVASVGWWAAKVGVNAVVLRVGISALPALAEASTLGAAVLGSAAVLGTIATGFGLIGGIVVLNTYLIKGLPEAKEVDRVTGFVEGVIDPLKASGLVVGGMLSGTSKGAEVGMVRAGLLSPVLGIAGAKDRADVILGLMQESVSFKDWLDKKGEYRRAE